MWDAVCSVFVSQSRPLVMGLRSWRSEARATGRVKGAVNEGHEAMANVGYKDRIVGRREKKGGMGKGCDEDDGREAGRA